MKQEVTVYDIARETGLSVATVSRCLNHPEMVKTDTRDIVEKAVLRMGFSKRLYKGAKQTVAEKKTPARHFLLLLPSPQNAFYNDIIEGARIAANGHGGHIFVDYAKPTEKTVGKYLESLEGIDFAGGIILSNLSVEVLSAIRAVMPIIQCSEYNDVFQDASFVSIDDEESEFKATEYIISKGCTKIAFFTAPFSFHYAIRRYHGFKRALEQYGVRENREQVLHIPHTSFKIASDVASRLLSGPERPEAIVCTSDVYASAVVKAASRLGIKIPGELMVFGFDNTALSETTTPEFSTINQPRFRLGFTAFETLEQELRNPLQRKQKIFLPTELVLRESTEGIQ